MATTLDSRRSVSVRAAWRAGASAAVPASGNRNKTSTNCFNLGLIFRRTAHFFRPPEQDFEAFVSVGHRVVFEV